MKKTVTALAMAGVLIFGGAASCNNPQDDPAPTDGFEVEFEDCDAEDFKNREAECGFTQSRSPSPRPMKTAYQKAPTRKAPEPVRTKRR